MSVEHVAGRLPSLLDDEIPLCFIDGQFR